MDKSLITELQNENKELKEQNKYLMNLNEKLEKELNGEKLKQKNEELINYIDCLRKDLVSMVGSMDEEVLDKRYIDSD